MNERIRKEALRAAAKVALALTPLAACGGSTIDAPSADGTTGSAHPPGSAEGALANAEDAAPRRTRDGGPPTTSDDADAVAADADVDLDASVADAAPEQCAALLDSVATWDDAGLLETIPVTPETTACCDSALKAYASWLSDRDGSFADFRKHMGACCELEWTVEPVYAKQPQWVHMACSPWGPPMPPAMVA